MKRRLMSLLLVVAMVLTMFPATAMASELDEQTPAETEVEAIDDAAAQVDDQAVADAVIALITALPTVVTLEREAAITEACEAYESLTETQKALVTNYDTLVAAEEVLAGLKAAQKAAADQEAADAVIERINAIGEVTLESETAITEACEAYESLTEAQKALVTNYETLTAAMEALSVLKVVAADDDTAEDDIADSSTEEVTPVDPGYDIVTGDTDSQGVQRVRVKNINISGVDVSKHQKTGDFAATVLLPTGTRKEAELTFTLDCIAAPNVTSGKIFVNDTQAGTMTANEGSTTEGTWTYSMVPEWNENGEATIAFRPQWGGVNWVTKTYTLNLRILGEKNAAPVFKGTSNETSELVAVGESFTMNLNEAALWEDPELDEISYTVSVDGGEPEEANGAFYQFGPKVPGEYQLVFRAQDSKGNKAEGTYTVNITAMTLTRFETGGTHVDSWNVDINRIDMGLAEVEQVIPSEEDGVYAYAILDSATSKENKLFFRVKASAYPNRFADVFINGKSIEGKTVDPTNFMWSAEYTPDWNKYGEASLTFEGRTPNSGSKYQYTIKLKIANKDNQAPEFADGSSKTDSAEQYVDYTVDVASLFTDVDDSWLSYSVSVDDGETYVACGDSYTITPHTTGIKTLKFKAKDISGAESGEFVLTLNVSGYEVNEDSFAIDKTTSNGQLLSLTVKDAEGNVIKGINFESTTEHKTKSYAEDSGTSFAGQTFEWDETTIRVGLPETVGVSDKVVAHWHMVQNEAGLPFLSTERYWNYVTYNTKDGVATTLSGGIGSSTVRFYDAEEVTFESHEWADRYIVEYYIDRGENNQAPKLKEGVEATVNLTMDQYQTYSVDLSTIFEEPEGDAVTYTVKVDDAEAVSTGKDYSRELTTDEDVTLIFKATDALGASCTYIVNLTVNAVHRLVIETGEGAGTFTSGINKFYIYGQPAEKFVFTKDGWNRYITVQLAKTVADDAEFELKWEGNTDGYTMTVDNPVKLVDGKAEFTFESTGHFFDKNHRYYNFSISNTPNNLPELAENVKAAVEENKMVGTNYEVNLASIFTDADGDDMTYTVSINGAEAVAADAAYSYLAETTGTYTLVFRAKDNWGASEATYTVTLVVANSDVTYDVVVKVPDAITPSFYASGSFDENGQDILGDALNAVKGASADGWTAYTVAVPDNISRISFRGTDGTSEWGGMSVATEKDMEPFAVRQVQAVINTKIDTDTGKVAPTADQVEFQVKYNVNEEGKYAVSGGTGTDTYGYLYYRFLLIAADNSIVYTYYTVPKGDLAGSFGTNEGQTKTVTTESAEVMIQTLPLATKNAFTITVPSEATAVMYRQAGYFNYEELPVFETIDNGDGTKDMVFNNVGSKAIFRASMEGKVTKAGYSTASYGGAGSVVIDWDDDDRSPNYRAEYDPSTMMGNRGDDSMYVNVNYRNNLQLGVGETFQLRAYRIWEIIDTDTTNIMIEPDFHYNIISGSDVIDITPTDDVGGIAGKSWLEITPKKEGTAILEVTYDAIEILESSDKSSFSNFKDGGFTFNASDPARTALVVIQVGGQKNDINFGFKLNRAEGWDVEFDTLYFTGDQGQLQLKPTVITDGEIAKVEVSGDKGMTYTELTEGEDGYYTANIVSGNNIIRVTKTDGSEHYHVVRGDKIEVVITEVAGASDQDGIIDAGEKINIKFKGVHNVIGKMSGIYNPNGYKTNFTYNGETIFGNGGQYTYPSGAQVEITVPGDADEGDQLVLTNGNTTNGGWGGSSGAHRSVKGEVPPGLDSEEVSHSGRNVFPEITLTVGGTLEEAEQIAVESIELNRMTMELEVGKSNTLTASVKPVDATDRTVAWTSSNENVATVENGVVTAVAAGQADITATAGKFSDSCEVTVISAKEEEPSLDFGLAENEILGYVTVSFVDKGVRVAGEEMNALYETPLGTIVEETQVPFKAYDTVAGVTLRLLKTMGMTESHSGHEDGAFYLSAIGNFKVNDVHYSTMGEFDAGQGSGWMITLNDVFINKGASEFYVKKDDKIEWQYTCQLGADIGDNTSAEAVAAVEALIAAIGTVTLDQEDEITTAREAYDALTSLQQSQVENYENLTNAEATLAILKTDKAEADKAIAKINEIPALDNLALTDEATVTAARTAYDALTDAQNDFVSDETLKKLTDAEVKIAQLKQSATDQEAADAVIAQINAIVLADINLEDKNAIAAIRTAYEALTDAQEDLVSAEVLKKLTDAEAKIAQLEADKTAADAVIEKINKIGNVTLDNEAAITEARTAYNTLSDAQKALVSNYSTLTAAEAALAGLKDGTLATEIQNIYTKTGSYLASQTPSTGTMGGEWLMLGLARAGYDYSAEFEDTYLAAAEAFVRSKNNVKLHESKSTENSRLIVALISIGVDVTNVEGINLLKGLADFDWVKKQGNNGTIWALIALDSGAYEIPASTYSNKTTREKLVAEIVGQQMDNGAWSISSATPVADIDATAMAIQALAPYYSQTNVKTAVDKALTYLSGVQSATGGMFAANASDNGDPESTAQVIIALTTMGIDPMTDSRFIKNGKTLFDGLKTCYTDITSTTGGFVRAEDLATRSASVDPMSTEQSYLAMVSYFRMKNSQKDLYDMSDVSIEAKYNITVSATNGTVTVTNANGVAVTKAAAGAALTATVTPAQGYKLVSLTINGQAQTTDAEGKVTFTMPAEAVTITATFTLDPAAVVTSINTLTVTKADAATQQKIVEIQAAYAALSDADKAAVTNYAAFQNKVAAFNSLLESAKTVAKAELNAYVGALKQTDYTTENWLKIQQYLAVAIANVTAAANTDAINSIVYAAKVNISSVAKGKEMTVTFRLIGDFQHNNGVTDHEEYVTWIPTTVYKMKAGATMYDVFMQAIADYGLSQRGASSNYVESIMAPSVLGGYWLGEFDNGVNSGWMYTVNGVHPGTGLKTYDLKDGDVIVWHYVDDYVQEERTSSSRYYYRWLEAEDITPAAYCNKVLGKILTIGKNGTASPNLTMAHIGQNVTFTFTPSTGYKVKNVTVDGVPMGSITSYTYKNLRIDSRIVVEFTKKDSVNFADVDVKDWFYEDVAFVVENELFEGTGGNLFSPNSSMTRAMLVTVLYRLEGEPAVYGTTSFGDVRSNQYYTDAVTWATRTGIVEGYDNGLFGTNDNVTREQMAAILYRYAAYKGYDVSDSNSLYQYSDTAKISGYAVKAMKWANAEGLITGRTSSTLAPQGTATRAEVAAIFHRFVESIVG